LHCVLHYLPKLIDQRGELDLVASDGAEPGDDLGRVISGAVEASIDE
jgi:hypothetical protein